MKSKQGDEKIEALKRTVLLSGASTISLNMKSDESAEDKSRYSGAKNKSYIEKFIEQVIPYFFTFLFC